MAGMLREHVRRTAPLTLVFAVLLSRPQRTGGPRNLSPLKWIMWSGLSAIQTSVPHAMLSMCRLNSLKSAWAVRRQSCLVRISIHDTRLLELMNDLTANRL
jgi:hypothetical protein